MIVDQIDVDSSWSISQGDSNELAHELVIGGSATDDNDDGNNWCQNSTDTFSSTGNSGTPGVDNTCIIDLL